MSAILAARLVSAAQIIAVDVVPSRLEFAQELGATHIVNGPTATILEAVRGDANFTLDTAGRPDMIRKAVDVLSVRGVAGILGGSPIGSGDFA